MRSVLAFGDSNTWGMVPGSCPCRRYPAGIRWTSIIQEKSGGQLNVIEEGLCGRTTAYEDISRHGRAGAAALPDILEKSVPLDAVILMLGTNDCKTVYGPSAELIDRGINLCIDEIVKYAAPEKVLLISPVFLGEDVWKPEKDPEFCLQSVSLSMELPSMYRGIAEKRGTAFLAASDFVRADSADDEHMNSEGHRTLAFAILEKLEQMNIINNIL